MLARTQRRRPDQRGAVAVFVAGVLAVLLLAGALAVDLNMQRVAARDAQAVADVVALDLARELDGRTKSTYSSAELDEAFEESLARNAGGLGAEQFEYELGGIGPDGHFVSIAPSVPATAVRVRATGSVAFSFAGRDGGVERDAVAMALGGGCFQLGTYAARIDLGDSFILGPLLDALGTGAQLSLLDAQGLVGADVTLLDLVNVPALGVASFEELLSLPLTVGEFYLAMAEVLRAESGQTAQVELLEGLASVPVGAARLVLSDILSVDTGAASGLAAGLNVFDLVTAAAFAANGDSVVDVPGLAINVLGLADIDTAITIGQKPSTGCGRPRSPQAVAESAQVDIDLTAALQPLDLSLVGLVGLQASGTVSLTAEVAPAEGLLEKIECEGDARTITVAVGSGLLDIEIGVDLRLSAVVLGARVPVADVDLAVGTDRSSPPSEVTITVEDGDYDVRGSTGDDSLGIPGLALRRSQVDVLGVLPVGGVVNALLTPLLGVLNPLVQALDQALLSPLLGALGINVAGADVYPVPVPECDVPVLYE